MNVERENLVAFVPDYACRENADTIVMVTGGIQNGKVVKIRIQYGRINYDWQYLSR